MKANQNEEYKEREGKRRETIIEKHVHKRKKTGKTSYKMTASPVSLAFVSL